MKQYFTLLSILCCFSAFAQIDMKTYEGNWEGIISNDKAFSIEIHLEFLQNQEYLFSISNGKDLVSQKVKSATNKNIQFNLWDQYKFSGVLNHDKNEVSGFIKSGILFYHLQLKKTSKNKYTGLWNIFMIDQFKDPKMYLSVEDANKEDYVAYPFFADQRFTGTWCTGFSKDKDHISFFDFKTGLQFKGQLLNEKIQLAAHFKGVVLTTVILEKSKTEWNLSGLPSHKHREYAKPKTLNDGWKTADLSNSNTNLDILNNMTDSVYQNALTYTHSILIAKKGKLVFEKYFSQYDENIPHDQRSAAKSVSSAIVGIAIDQKLIKNTDQKIYDYLPAKYQYTKDLQKSEISVEDLLTMSSGIDAVDFGTDRQSAASENSYQNSPDWLKTVLEAPMIYQPGEHANYGSANPFLLGVMLQKVIEDPLELYMDQNLLSPLGISNYVIPAEITGHPYFGGGMYLTPRDMLKFGQLYLNQGEWNGKRILSREWVNASFQKYHVLENTSNKNEYGFLWWHKTYQVKGQAFKAIEARGSGGQYISLIPELDLVVTITSGNFRNGRFWQPEKIIEEYILPAMNNGAITKKNN